MLSWPLEHQVVEQDENGHQTIHIHPSRWTFASIIRAIALLDDKPDKVALTDPTGTHQYGQDPDDLRRMFQELLEAERRVSPV
jgi:hypothetical protein